MFVAIPIQFLPANWAIELVLTFNVPSTAGTDSISGNGARIEWLASEMGYHKYVDDWIDPNSNPEEIVKAALTEMVYKKAEEKNGGDNAGQMSMF